MWADSPAYNWYPSPGTKSTKGETNIDDNTASGQTQETTLKYGEGIYVGYRYFEKIKVNVLFPFRFGLSYTSFDFSNLILPEKFAGDSIQITFKLKNTGNYGGAETAQLYVSQNIPSIDRPVK